MLGSAIYGALLGVGFVAVQRVAPQPIGWVVWWAFFAVQLAWGSVLTWRRTALPFMTGALLVGSATAALLAVLSAAGFVFPALPFRFAVPVYFLMAVGPSCLLIESRLHRREWLRWKEHMQDKSAWDILLGRHIPDFRSAERGGA